MPDAFVEASRKVTPAEQFEGWEQGVRALYDQMVLITIEPDWAKLLDFETTIPSGRNQDLLRELAPQILDLYGLLERITGNPMVTLNRAVAAAEHYRTAATRTTSAPSGST